MRTTAHAELPLPHLDWFLSLCAHLTLAAQVCCLHSASTHHVFCSARVNRPGCRSFPRPLLVQSKDLEVRLPSPSQPLDFLPPPLFSLRTTARAFRAVLEECDLGSSAEINHARTIGKRKNRFCHLPTSVIPEGASCFMLHPGTPSQELHDRRVSFPDPQTWL